MMNSESRPKGPSFAAGCEVDGDATIGGPAATDPMGVRLVVVKGVGRGRTFEMTGHQGFLAGRSSRAHLRLPKTDRYASRIHFMIEINPPCCRLVDMGSRNGTKVNRQRVECADLHDGDLIQVGRTLLKISLLGNWDAAQKGIPAASHARPQPPEAAAGNLATQTSPMWQERISPPVPSAPRPIPASQTPAGSRGEGLPSIPGYRCLRELGRGGMGIVYLAMRKADGGRVAVKTVQPAVGVSPEETQRFLREVAILSQLRHPNIVAFHESGEAGGLLFFVMDYVEGTNASQILKDQGPWDIPRAVRLLCQTLAALAYAHERGFVHRDVKPANLLVGSQDQTETCTLADFGLARMYHASSLSGLTILGDVGGTIPYMAPEQILDYRHAQPAADQYAAAATLYHLLTGQHVYEFEGVSSQFRLSKILCDPAVPIRERRPDVPERLAQAIHRALGKSPDSRFRDVMLFRRALLPFGGEGA